MFHRLLKLQLNTEQKLFLISLFLCFFVWSWFEYKNSAHTVQFASVRSVCEEIWGPDLMSLHYSLSNAEWPVCSPSAGVCSLAAARPQCPPSTLHKQTGFRLYLEEQVFKLSPFLKWSEVINKFIIKALSLLIIHLLCNNWSILKNVQIVVTLSS